MKGIPFGLSVVSWEVLPTSPGVTVCSEREGKVFRTTPLCLVTHTEITNSVNVKNYSIKIFSLSLLVVGTSLVRKFVGKNMLL